MPSTVSRLIGLAVVGCLGLTSGCATVRPPSSLPPTGWPRPASTTTFTGPISTPTSSVSEVVTRVSHQGVTLPLPPGYVDATDLVTGDQTAGPIQLVAFLRYPGQHQITVQFVSTEYADLAGFVDFYAKAQDAPSSEASITERHNLDMGGRPGVQFILKNRATGELSTMCVALRAPKSLVMVSGVANTPTRQAAVETVAKGLQLS